VFVFITPDPEEEGEEDREGEGGESNNYLLETPPSNMRLMTYAALLCAHPAHREEQADMLAKLNASPASLQ
jgi:hypothetical protein